MALIKMYPAAANSPGTELAEDITAAQTTITVISGSALPDAPNLFTIGSDETAETVKYTGKNGNTLTGCTRGFDGTAAKGWSAGAKVARYFAAYDHNTFIGNITDLDTRVTAVKQTADTAKATADTAKQTADKAETPDGAQQKVDKALQDAKNYTDTTKTSIYQDYSRFPVYCDKTTDGVDATSAKVTLPTLAGSNYVSAGLQFIAHKDIKGAYIQIGTNTTKYKVVSALGGNAIDIKVNQMYSGRINGTDFLLDSGSASGGAAILGGFEEEGTYVATLNPGDIVVGNNNKYAGYRMSFPTLSSDNRGIAFSRETADGEFCVMFNNSATDQNKVAIYQRKKYANFAKIANVDVAPGGDVTCVAMDPDGKYFVVGSKSAPYINIYLRNGLTFNKASNPGTLPSGQVSCVDISQDGFRIAVGLAISGASDRVIAYSVNNTKTVFTRNTIAGNIKGAPACISFVGPTYDFAVGSINIASGSGGEMAVFSGSADTYKLTSIDYTSLYISSCCSTTDGKFIIFTLGGTASGTNNINVLETANMYKGNPKITTNKTAYMVCFNKQNSAFAFYTDSTDGIQVWGYTPSTESFFYKGSFTGYDAANGAQPSFSYYDLVVYPGYNGTNTRSLGMDLTFSKNQDMDMYSPYDRMLGFVKEAGIANDVKHKITGISRRKGDIK